MARLFRAIRAREDLFDTKGMREKARRAQVKWATETLRLVKQYPPPPAASTYQRTFALQRGWRKDGPNETGNSFFTRVVNDDVDYVRLVQGPPGEQAAVHRGRWPSIEQITAITRPPYLAELQQIIARRGR